MNFLPSTVTLLNLCFGSLSLIYTLNHNYRWAALFILLAMIMDAIDGRVARRFKVTSDFGKELDSLSDMVSFGAAPSLLVLAMFSASFTEILYGYAVLTAVCIIFILCGAYRLARFNVLNINDHYIGVPITMAGSLVALLVLLLPGLSSWFFVLILIALSFLMVSRVTIRKL